MTQTFDAVDKLRQEGILQHFIKKGIVPATVLDNHNIYQEYLQLKKKYRHSSQQRIIQMICDKTGFGKTKVYNAISQMK